MEEKEKNKSSYKSFAWRSLSARWAFVASLWEDSYQIRERGKEVLKQMSREPDKKYDIRLNDAVFENDFRGMIEGIAGKVFKKDPTPTDVHPEITSLFQDIDGCGNSFSAFNQSGFEFFLRDGNAAIFVDAPPLSGVAAEKVADGQTPSLADRKDDTVNWIIIKAAQIINYKFEKQGSKEVLARVTIEERTIESDPATTYGEVEVVRHRILEIGSFTVEKWDEKTKDFILDPDTPQGKTGLDFIPLFPADDFAATPPFMTLAMLNAKLYNAESRFDDSIYIATVPRWIEQYDNVEDAKAAEEMKTASSAIGKKIFGQYAKAYYAETSGAALGVAGARNETIQKKIDKFGFQMFMPSEFVQRTATEIEDTAGHRESKVARLARKWQNCVEKALYATAQYLNVIKGKSTINLTEAEKAKMKLVLDYDRLTFSIDQLRAFDLLNDKGKISDKTFLEKLAIITEIDVVEEETRLKEQKLFKPVDKGLSVKE